MTPVLRRLADRNTQLRTSCRHYFFRSK